MIRAVICDDEKAALIIIRHFIVSEKLPIQIVGTADNGIEALRLIQTEKPDLIFMDIHMPFMNGLEILEKVRNSRVIIITAYDSFEHAQRALRLGATDILAKPIDLEQLKQAVIAGIGWSYTENAMVNTVLAHLHEHYNEKITLEELSELTFCSVNHMSRTFKRYMGMSVLNYVHKIRIEKSARLLEDKIPVKEAADRVGYQNLNHYYKYFKEFTGQTPAQYAKRGGGTADVSVEEKE